MEEINMLLEHPLQKIYNDAVGNQHWVFYHWFPFYKQAIMKYKQQAIDKNWEHDEFQKLLKDTTGNRISDLKQKNFECKEFEEIKTIGIQ